MTTLDNGVVIDESVDAVHFTSPENCLSVFGHSRTIESFTIHHWGVLGQNFYDVRGYLASDNPRSSSAHFVAMDGSVSCIVSPANSAWHAGNALGNATSVGIECRPEATDGDYATIASLIRYLRSVYGDLPLVPHNSWVSTDCPGNWDLNRLDSLARNKEDDMGYDPGAQWYTDMVNAQARIDAVAAKALTKDDLPAIADAILGREFDWYGFDGNVPANGRKTTTVKTQQGWVDSQVAALQGALIGLTELVKQLSLKQGVTIDYAAIAKAVNDDAAARLEH